MQFIGPILSLRIIVDFLNRYVIIKLISLQLNLNTFIGFTISSYLGFVSGLLLYQIAATIKLHRNQLVSLSFMLLLVMNMLYLTVEVQLWWITRFITSMILSTLYFMIINNFNRHETIMTFTPKIFMILWRLSSIFSLLCFIMSDKYFYTIPLFCIIISANILIFFSYLSTIKYSEDSLPIAYPSFGFISLWRYRKLLALMNFLSAPIFQILILFSGRFFGNSNYSSIQITMLLLQGDLIASILFPILNTILSFNLLPISIFFVGVSLGSIFHIMYTNNFIFFHYKLIGIGATISLLPSTISNIFISKTNICLHQDIKSTNTTHTLLMSSIYLQALGNIFGISMCKVGYNINQQYGIIIMPAILLTLIIFLLISDHLNKNIQ